MRTSLYVLSLAVLSAADINVARKHRALASRKRDSAALPAGWQTLAACANDNPRVLTSEDVWSTQTNTPSECVAFCDANGYTYAGVEYGQECHCSRAINGALLTSLPAAACSMPCTGDPTQTCGGGFAIQLFYSDSTEAWDAPLAPGWSVSYACAVDDRSARSLCNDQLNSIDDVNDPATCMALCAAQGYPVAGVEYGQECHCGTGIMDGVQAAPLSDCYQACTGNAGLNCGAPDRIQIYTLDDADITSCPNPTATLSSSSTTSSPSSSSSSSTTSSITSSSTTSSTTSSSTSSSTTSSSTSTTKPSSTSTSTSTTTTTKSTTTVKSTTTTKPCGKSTTTAKPSSTTTPKPTSTSTTAKTTSTSTTTTKPCAKPTTPAKPTPTAAPYTQCDGLLWRGPSICATGYKCQYINFLFSWCSK